MEVVHADAALEWTEDVRRTRLSEWRRVVRVNLDGVFLVCRSALRSMCGARSGTVVVTTSPHALAFLASPLASRVAGASVSVDGGLMAALPSGPAPSHNN
ncbi:MAG: SDR family NAD(P)-dependent oxidoreductase [Actinomycetota bacterium]|nr:SDR family NAD(P)-dependent oxidoreductase [Actinomycetota bacterium]